MRGKLLILGGTGEARALAQAVTQALPDLPLVSSLAGRTRAPLLPQGDVRVGGFGGAEGLARMVEAEGVTLLVNATHPYAAAMSRNALAAHRATGVPLLRLLRPAWQKRPGDSWVPVPDVAAAAEMCRWLGKRIFLSLGAKDLAQFAALTQAHFLVRLVDAPETLPLAHYDLVTGRGPFSAEGERALIAGHGIDLIVTKNSGGEATYAKIEVARELGIPVVMIRRPETALNPGGDQVASVEAAVDWIIARSSDRTREPATTRTESP